MIIVKKMETFNVNVKGLGLIPVSAFSWEEALEIVQAYLDKRSLNYTIEDE